MESNVLTQSWAEAGRAVLGELAVHKLAVAPLCLIACLVRVEITILREGVKVEPHVVLLLEVAELAFGVGNPRQAAGLQEGEGVGRAVTVDAVDGRLVEAGGAHRQGVRAHVQVFLHHASTLVAVPDGGVQVVASGLGHVVEERFFTDDDIDRVRLRVGVARVGGVEQVEEQ
eukprot:UN3353